MHGWLHVIPLQHPPREYQHAHARQKRATADRGRQHGAVSSTTAALTATCQWEGETDRGEKERQERKLPSWQASIPFSPPALWIPTHFQVDRVNSEDFKNIISPYFFFSLLRMVFEQQQTSGLLKQVWETAATAPLLPVSKGKCRARSRFQHRRAQLLRSRTQTETPILRRAPPRSNRSSRSPRALAPAPRGKGWCLQPALWFSQPGWSTPLFRSGISRWNLLCWWAWSRSGRLATGT